MTLRVFALQFLDGHHYAEDENAAYKNIHRKALGAIGILLLERTDLVKRFFTRSSLEDPDIDKVIFLVYTERCDNEKQNPGRCIKSVKQRAIPSLNCRIKEEDMILLAECANHAAFFKDMIDSATISDLLHCRLSVPLVADNLMGDLPISLTSSVRCTLSGETGKRPLNVAVPSCCRAGKNHKDTRITLQP